MKTFLVSLSIAIASALIVALPADAKSRFGSGKSSGMQRDSAKPSAATPPTTAAAPAAATAGAAAATAAKPAAAAGNKWLGPLAGLAAGGLLASMFMGGGFGGLKIFDFIMILGLAAGAFFLFRMWRNKNAANNQSAPSNLQYAGAGADAGNAAPTAPQPMQRANQGSGFATPEIGSRLQSVSSPAEATAMAQAPRVPADFAVEPFARHARGAFIRMQAANDAGDKADIRDFTTPEMYAEISMQIQERKGETQRTDVTKLDVTVLEVVTENSKAIASVRFTGELMFDGETKAEMFDEVWHVVKRVDDENSTWQVAGIQQLS